MSAALSLTQNLPWVIFQISQYSIRLAANSPKTKSQCSPDAVFCSNRRASCRGDTKGQPTTCPRKDTLADEMETKRSLIWGEGPSKGSCWCIMMEGPVQQETALTAFNPRQQRWAQPAEVLELAPATSLSQEYAQEPARWNQWLHYGLRQAPATRQQLSFPW